MVEQLNTKITRAIIVDYYSISVSFSTPISFKIAQRISFFDGKNVSDFSVKKIFENSVVISVKHLDLKKKYFVAYDNITKEVTPYNILDKKEFIYEGNDLGVTFSKEKSIFKVYSPVSTRVVLNIFDDLEGNNKQNYFLVEDKAGVWTVEVNGNLRGKFYSYNVDGPTSNFNFARELIDPYSRCVIGNTRKSMIIDLNDYPKVVSGPVRSKMVESIIYEIHIKDISIDTNSGVSEQNRGRYSAFLENNTFLYGDYSTNINTLIKHFKELGVNTIQIMPIQDFDSDEENPQFYGWGYMPKNFNSPEGSYSSDWKTDSKIYEVKKLINRLHEEGFKVTLDVVYNHTAEGFKGKGIYSFNGFVPYYYYRIAHNGVISNGSGCGNEFRTESPMGRKFIVDSLKFWTEFYGFDGFRFDLMGLIDLTTVELIVKELRKIKPDILIYGEPWTGGLTPIQPTYKASQKNKGFSVFNDEFRDAIKGAVFDRLEKGYIQTEGHYYHDKIIEGILGSINTFTASPCESINYIEVHDNNTLFDKLVYTQQESLEFKYPQDDNLEIIILLHKLSAFILLTSQGIPILHLGQDFMRTKQGVENSYNSGDSINKIDWSRKKEFFSVFSYYKTLINIRKHHCLFRFDNEQDLRNSITFRPELLPIHFQHAIIYTLESGKKYGDSVDEFLVVINPYKKDLHLKLNKKYKKMLIGENYYFEESIINDTIEIPKISGAILFR